MKHEIMEEDMCYGYLRSILTTFYFTCVPFLDEERRARREPAVFIEFEQYAERWLIRGGRQSPRLTADNPSRDFPAPCGDRKLTCEPDRRLASCRGLIRVFKTPYRTNFSRPDG